MESFSFSIPQNIVFGRGSLSKLPELAGKLGKKKAFIILGPHLNKIGMVGKCKEALSDAGIEATSEDLSRISEGKVPTSLLYDSVHYNSSGYSVISDCIYNKLKALNYINQ